MNLLWSPTESELFVRLTDGRIPTHVSGMTTPVALPLGKSNAPLSKQSFLLYYDTAGSEGSRSTDAMTCAVVVAKDRAWEKYDRRFAKFLERNELTEWHTADIPREPEDRWARRCGELTAIIKQCTSSCFALSMQLSEYDEANHDGLVNTTIGGPWTVVQHTTWTQALRWLIDTKAKSVLTSNYVEEGDVGQRDWDRFLIKRNHPPAFYVNKKTCSEAQKGRFAATDFIAWHSRRAFATAQKQGKQHPLYDHLTAQCVIKGRTWLASDIRAQAGTTADYLPAKLPIGNYGSDVG